MSSHEPAFPDPIQVGDDPALESITYSLVSNQLLVRFDPVLDGARADLILQDVGANRIEVIQADVSDVDLQAFNELLFESNWLWIVFDDDGRSQREVLHALAAHGPRVVSACPVYDDPSGQFLSHAAAVLLDRVLVEIDGLDPEAVKDALVNLDVLTIDSEIGDSLAPYYVFQLRYPLDDPQQSFDVLDTIRGTDGVARADHGWMQLTGFFNLIPNDREYTAKRVLPTPNEYWGLSAINVEAAWDIRAKQGGTVVHVAIIDGGFERHEDIEFDAKTPPDEFGGPIADRRHGMNVTGIAAAKTNNGIGTVGVGFDCVVHPIRLRTYQPEHIGLSILQAVNRGATVINMSAGFPRLNDIQMGVIHQALQYAHANDVVFVAAAGNKDRDYVDYPARDPLAIGVGAVMPDLRRRPNSNFNIGLDFVAPGERCWTTGLSDKYEPFDATSCAAPHVTGLVALIRSIRPDLSADAINSIMHATCQKILQGTDYTYAVSVEDRMYGRLRWDPQVGFGLIDCAAVMNDAVKAVAGPSRPGRPHHDARVLPKLSFDGETGSRYCGYLGKGPTDKQVRVFCDLNLSEWLDIEQDDILAMFPEDPKTYSELARMVVIVRHGAMVKRSGR